MSVFRIIWAAMLICRRLMARPFRRMRFRRRFPKSQMKMITCSKSHLLKLLTATWCGINGFQLKMNINSQKCRELRASAKCQWSSARWSRPARIMEPVISTKAKTSIFQRVCRGRSNRIQTDQIWLSMKPQKPRCLQQWSKFHRISTKICHYLIQKTSFLNLIKFRYHPIIIVNLSLHLHREAHGSSLALILLRPSTQTVIKAWFTKSRNS